VARSASSLRRRRVMETRRTTPVSAGCLSRSQNPGWCRRAKTGRVQRAGLGKVGSDLPTARSGIAVSHPSGPWSPPPAGQRGLSCPLLEQGTERARRKPTPFAGWVDGSQSRRTAACKLPKPFRLG